MSRSDGMYASRRASLEAVVESDLLPLSLGHPGGMELTAELAQLCGLAEGDRVLDAACGRGESARLLADRFGCRVTGVDLDAQAVETARGRPVHRGAVEFLVADAHDLPFGADAFDVVICECTLCLLTKRRALEEMLRVVRRGGAVGIADLCWTRPPAERLRRRLARIEGERPETREGWQALLDASGLADVEVHDRSAASDRWMRQIDRQLGWAGRLRLLGKVLRRWGVRGLWDILRSERVFRSRCMGYALMVGRKR